MDKGPQKNTIENLRKMAEFYDISKYIVGLGQIVRENLPEEKKEAARTKIDGWTERASDALDGFEAKVITIDQALPMVKGVFMEMTEFAKTEAQLSSEQLSPENLLAKQQEVDKKIKDLLKEDNNA